MKIHTPIKTRQRLVLALGLAAAMTLGLAATLRSEDTKADPNARKPATPGVDGTAAPAEKKAKPAPIKITGAELYSMHCARCHPERYPNERTAAQWKTIVLHMRVRANLPAEHANSILKYMQENSGY